MVFLRAKDLSCLTAVMGAIEILDRIWGGM